MPTKAELRRELRTRLRALAGSAERAQWSEAICRAIAAHPAYLQARRVALFDAMAAEPDVGRLWELAPRSFFYPRVAGEELRLFEVRSCEALPEAAEGKRFREPAHDGGPGADLQSIDLVLVPGLAFTRAGERLGRGGGYYDRLLARRLPGTFALGVCFAMQIVAEVPREAHDLAVDAVVTGNWVFPAVRPFLPARGDLTLTESMQPAAIGIIGGSGLYQIDGLTEPSEHSVDTPWGKPSDVIFGGRLAGRQVYFLPRHGRGHRIMPHELNHRANIYALRSLGVRWIICVTAVGSLQERYAPRHLVLPSQFFDRTSRRAEHTFFGGGIVAHIAFADPISTPLRQLIAKAAVELGLPVHNGGTYVNMDGPAFSTRAESDANRQLGFDVIGMTNLGEAKLAREAEIALATIAMITDYDCWKVEEAPVTADAVLGHLLANAETAKALLAKVIPQLPETPDWPEHRALDTALVTSRSLWPPETVQKLGVLLERVAS